MGKASASTPGPTGLLRFSGTAVLVCGFCALTSATQAQTGATATAQVPSVVFQDTERDSRDGSASSPPAAAPQTQVGFAGSLIFQDPKGNYASDHKDASAFGFSLQLPIRTSRQWTFLPTYTRMLSNLNSALDHETKSTGLDVHWRGPNPGVGYLLLGGGSAQAQLNVLRTQCDFLVIGCSQTSTSASSKTAPYLQAGFGFEGDQLRGHGGWFIEARMWRGPYLQPISLSNGTLVGSKAKTGNALQVAFGFRLLGPAF
jgi:hypothetical protein